MVVFPFTDTNIGDKSIAHSSVRLSYVHTIAYVAMVVAKDGVTAVT